ncbi:AAA family ATPase [Corynebacterium sp. KPL2848]|uniref:AAA family ATPase n=1 Tax=Corynebacterium sp. KPL2848 TaxID=3158317 RepID=UPI0032EF45AB
MRSSSSEDLLEPLNEAVEGLQEIVISLLPWAIALIVAAIVLQALAPWLWSKWWYRKHPIAGKIQRRKKQISELFGLTIHRVHRDGRIRISPGETAAWQREGLAEELSTVVHQEMRISVDSGYAHIRAIHHIGNTVEGNPSYDPTTGQAIIGVDVEDGEPAGFSLRDISGVVVGARPGSGKTVLLRQIQGALKPHADVEIAEGKGADDLVRAVRAIESAQKEMNTRFEQGIDFWKDSQGLPLRVLILDECHRIFDAESEDKADKNAAKERVRMVRDLVQRGRSAGVITVLATQRMSADVIPTSIRDLATVRICGRVTGDDSRLVMGRLPEPGEPDPSRLKSRRIVVDDGDGVWREMHVFERHNG